MPPQYAHDHVEHCQGDVRQCLVCGGRMCDCGSADADDPAFVCIHCGAVAFNRDWAPEYAAADY